MSSLNEFFQRDLLAKRNSRLFREIIMPIFIFMTTWILIVLDMLCFDLSSFWDKCYNFDTQTYHCDKCEKTFRSKNGLKIHYSVHTGLRWVLLFVVFLYPGIWNRKFYLCDRNFLDFKPHWNEWAANHIKTANYVISIH